MNVVGTPHYCAPEILQGKKYNESVDVYRLHKNLLESLLIVLE